MEKGSHFDWRSLGKPDYSQAHALVASLPEQQRWQIEGVSREILARLLHLAWICSSKSGRGSAYCYPTLFTLAKYVGRSVRTVERHLSVLRACGLIQWTRRKSTGGAWTSNLYTMGKVFLASLFARMKGKVKQFRDTTKMSDNDLKREYKVGESDAAHTRLEELRQKARLKSQIWPMGPSGSEAQDTWGDEDTTAERKALLRKQAQHLIGNGL